MTEKSIKFIKCAKCNGNLLRCDCKWPPAHEDRTRFEIWTRDDMFICVRYSEDIAILALDEFANRWPQGLEIRKVESK